MKKKVVSLLLMTAMAVSVFAGCGKKDGADEEKVEISSGGKVLNIYCWNEEFKSRLSDHYAGYEVVDATTGKIGEVTVKWNITPNADNAYQNNLDEALLKQANAAADDKIDIFLVEADYAKKYVDTSYTVPVADLGITSDDVKNQYKYTQDVMTDANGKLKGLSWQACPGVLYFNREIAKEVFGTDDAAEIQSYVKDWATFAETANTLKAAGYKIMASAEDTYRVYSNNVTSGWVTEDNKINIDPNVKKWVDDSKKLVDAGVTDAYELWSTEWSAGMFEDNKVFCYFGPAWFINFSMSAGTEGSVATNGGWNLTEGPQGFFWGGTWIAAANYTDNADLIKDIMLALTTDETVMNGIVEKDDDFVNNKPAMEAKAEDASYKSNLLGGINPLGIYVKGAETIDASYLGAYDQGCGESFKKAMRDYFNGKATYEEALELFYKEAIEKYPNLKK